MPTILCVDDEKPILASLRRLFRNIDCTLLLADNGHKALEIMSQNNVDIIISDMRMPEMDGATLLSETAKKWPEIHRILLTGYSNLDDYEKAENDIYRRIDKPWNDEELITTVQNLLV